MSFVLQDFQSALREMLGFPELELLRAVNADYVHFAVKWRPDLVDVEKAVDDSWERNR